MPHLKGMPALIFTKENPFSLFKTLKKSKTNAPAKANQTAPFDLIVPKGPTSFAPGPVIGELAILGIKSGVEINEIINGYHKYHGQFLDGYKLRHQIIPMLETAGFIFREKSVEDKRKLLFFPAKEY